MFFLKNTQNIHMQMQIFKTNKQLQRCFKNIYCRFFPYPLISGESENCKKKKNNFEWKFFYTLDDNPLSIHLNTLVKVDNQISLYLNMIFFHDIF